MEAVCACWSISCAARGAPDRPRATAAPRQGKGVHSWLRLAAKSTDCDARRVLARALPPSAMVLDSAAVAVYGALPLSMVHGALPSHWLPFAAVSRAQQWPLSTALLVTAAGAAAHVLSTALLGGVAATVAGAALGEETVNQVSSAVLLLLGSRYVYVHWRVPPERRGACCSAHGHGHSRSHSSGGKVDAAAVREGVSDWQAALGVVTVPMLSPCATTLPIFISAAESGPGVLLALIASMLLCTMTVMCGLVGTAVLGFKRLNTQWLEKNDRMVVGLCLFAIGLVTLLFPHDHDHHEHGHGHSQEHEHHGHEHDKGYDRLGARGLAEAAIEAVAGEVCELELLTGPCRAAIPRYGFDSAEGACVSFIYGGCAGNANNFATLEACRAACDTFGVSAL